MTSNRNVLQVVFGVDKRFLAELPQHISKAEKLLGFKIVGARFEDVVTAEASICARVGVKNIHDADPHIYGLPLMILLGEVLRNELSGKWDMERWEGNNEAPVIRLGSNACITPWVVLLSMLDKGRDSYGMSISSMVYSLGLRHVSRKRLDQWNKALPS